MAYSLPLLVFLSSWTVESCDDEDVYMIQTETRLMFSLPVRHLRDIASFRRMKHNVTLFVDRVDVQFIVGFLSLPMMVK